MEVTIRLSWIARLAINMYAPLAAVFAQNFHATTESARHAKPSLGSLVTSTETIEAQTVNDKVDSTSLQAEHNDLGLLAHCPSIIQYVIAGQFLK